MNPTPRHVCILGCGRSGTSIFGELFQALPAYRYYSEPEWEDFINIDFSTPVAVKVPRPPDGVTTSAGLPFHLQDFLRVFPSSGVIFWQVRHPLDTICSLRVGISNDWGHHPRPADYQQWQKKPLVQQCAYHWNHINTLGYNAVRHLALLNRFEDMVSKPFETAVAQVSRADPAFNHYLPQIRQWAERVQDSNNHKYIEADCSRPYSRDDHTKKIGRWKENLTKQELHMVLPLVKEGSELLGYKLPLLSEKT